MAKFCPECGRTREQVCDIYEVELCPECLAKVKERIKGVSANYWEEMSLIENQNDRIKNITYERLKDNAMYRGLQYIAEFGSTLRQKARMTKDKDLAGYYMRKYDEFTELVKENMTEEEFQYYMEDSKDEEGIL